MQNAGIKKNILTMYDLLNVRTINGKKQNIEIIYFPDLRIE